MAIILSLLEDTYLAQFKFVSAQILSLNKVDSPILSKMTGIQQNENRQKTKKFNLTFLKLLFRRDLH